MWDGEKKICLYSLTTAEINTLPQREDKSGSPRTCKTFSARLYLHVHELNLKFKITLFFVI